MNEKRKKIKQYKLKVENLKKHNKFYHGSDKPEISDKE